MLTRRAHKLSQRYERAPMVITSNRAYKHWYIRRRAEKLVGGLPVRLRWDGPP
jgi:hypothetical protein